MADTVTLRLAEAEDLAAAALEASGASAGNARATARALVAAEADGQAGHGLSRVGSYALHVRCGKVDGRAVPRIERAATAALRVDAGRGVRVPGDRRGAGGACAGHARGR